MMAKRKYYATYDEVPPQADPFWEDQRHINRAYTLYRLYMAEMLQVRKTDKAIDRIRRNMYATEDCLNQYIAAIPREEVI